MKLSIVILTYNRRDRVSQQMKLLSNLTYEPIEIIVVDNCSDEPINDLISEDRRAILIRNSENLGATGRNRGIEVATGDIIVTLDDDVYGLVDNHLCVLCHLMESPDVAAVNFKIQEEGTGRIINWCHPYIVENFAGNGFETNEISEGAVAFKRSALMQVGLYPEYFFISHEGPDMALRLINAGWRVIYCPDIVVTHAYDQRARASWRRYYFDTRNQLWLIIRNLSFWYGFKRLAIGWCSMLVYSIRDGYLRYWLKAVWDALLGAPRAWRDRIPPTSQARKRWLQIEQQKPGFWKMVKKRLFSREVRI